MLLYMYACLGNHLLPTSFNLPSLLFSVKFHSADQLFCSNFFKTLLEFKKNSHIIFQWWGKAWLYLWSTDLLVNQSALSALGCIPWRLMDLIMTSLLKYSLDWFSCNSMVPWYRFSPWPLHPWNPLWLVLPVKTEVMKAFSISPFSMSSVSRVPPSFTHRTTCALILLLPLILWHADVAALRAGIQTIPQCLYDPKKIVAPEVPMDL